MQFNVTHDICTKTVAAREIAHWTERQSVYDFSWKNALIYFAFSCLFAVGPMPWILPCFFESWPWNIRTIILMFSRFSLIHPVASMVKSPLKHCVTVSSLNCSRWRCALLLKQIVFEATELSVYFAQLSSLGDNPHAAQTLSVSLNLYSRSANERSIHWVLWTSLQRIPDQTSTAFTSPRIHVHQAHSAFFGYNVFIP